MNSTETKHTPGEWIARGDMVMAHRPTTVGGYNEESIFSLHRHPDERKANARLIAAAPEMLAMLEQCAEAAATLLEVTTGGQRTHDGLEQIRDMARRVIAKATA